MLNAVRPSYEESSSVDVCISLAEIVCQSIVLIQRCRMSSGQHDTYPGCLTICISVLAALAPPQESVETTWGDRSGFNARMIALLKQYNVIQSLAVQISSTTASDGFLGSEIAVIGDADMLSLLIGSELTLLLPKRTTFPVHSIDSFPMRGYVGKVERAQHDQPHDETHALNRGADDPRHRVWRSSIKFVAALLRSATTQNCDTITQAKCFDLALDFLSANTESIKTCLQQCTSIYFNQDSPVLTMHVLEEAGLLLSLAGELCSEVPLDTFQRKYGDLHNIFFVFSKSVLASLSCFVGSSVTSRELFGCIDNVEDADTMALDSISHLSDLGHMFFTLSGGISNARHEAIRYSHFASVSGTILTFANGC